MEILLGDLFLTSNWQFFKSSDASGPPWPSLCWMMITHLTFKLVPLDAAFVQLPEYIVKLHNHFIHFTLTLTTGTLTAFCLDVLQSTTLFFQPFYFFQSLPILRDHMIDLALKAGRAWLTTLSIHFQANTIRVPKKYCPSGPACERKRYLKIVVIDTASEHEEDLRNKSIQEKKTNH